MVVTLLITFLLIQKFIIFPTFESLEQQYAKADIDRVEEVILDTINQLDRQVYDWSSWDKTYDFIGNENNDYIENNLSPETFSNLRVNLVYFLDTDFQPVWVQTFNFALHDYKDVKITTDNKNVQHSLLLLQNTFKALKSLSIDEPQDLDGLFFQDGIPVAFSIRPIFDTKEVSAPKGYLIFGRNLDQLTLEKFSKQIKKDFKVEVVSKKPLSMSDFSTNNYAVEILNENQLNVFKTYLVDNKTVFRISTTHHRVITQAGQNSLKYALPPLLVIGLIMILLITVLLKKRVFGLLSNLTQQMQGISESKNYSLRASISSADEIGVLSKEFNNMLTVIEANNDDLVKANEEIKQANSELKKLSLTDPLTQITNRLGLERKLRLEWAALSREQKPIAIIMIDIDYFKLFNDTYGHIEGDNCLQKFAGLLNNNTRRPRDMAARFGGEEFTIVLPETDIQAAMHIARQIQDDIANSRIKHKGSEISEFITASFGIECVVPSAAMSVNSMIYNADKALYVAKQKGRNRITISERLN